ncbi:hypothetical protein CXF85_18175 [Colwellia sp. 75C3]|uniref:ATP-binding protein n=1 Tax=Colwellia sp. 75C3 TaxID=888425 RepID=UPI000C32E2C8|nr:ATP-binding protein [Colwellia sp. 75C3]PKG81398.1 hypothetical protein CXF85_18175 [Colwellia sp. 75C3]
MTKHLSKNKKFQMFSFVIAFLILGVLISLSLKGFEQSINNSVLQSASQNAKIIASIIREFRQAYTVDVVQKVQAYGIKVSHEYHSKPDTIPLPASASLELGKKINIKDLGVVVDLVSPYPFPWRDRSLTAFENRAWQALQNNSLDDFSEVSDDGLFKYAVAERMVVACVKCHNTYPDSPKTDWKLNDLRGVLVVKIMLDPIKKAAESNIQTIKYTQLLTLCLIVISILILIVFLLENREKLLLAVEERTEKLNQETKKAVTASEIKSNFLATMSHEIRTPMNGIIGMLTVISPENLNTEQKSQLETASLSAQNLLHIINGILDFSKLEANKMILELSTFNIVNLVHSVTHLMSVEAKNKNIILTTNCTDVAFEIIKSDEGKLRQILYNLVSNAIKFTLHGRVSITAKVSIDDNQAATLEISIKDTGIGLETEQLHHLFDQFTQADSSTTRKFGGTGLGLSITKQLTELLDGTLTVESELAKGTCFKVTLPIQTVVNELNLNADLLSIDDIKNLSFPDNFKVLVVEDNRINQRVMKSILNKFSIEHDIVGNGQLAIDTLKATSVDDVYAVILMDCQMPVMDGLTATKLIRQGEAGEHHQSTHIIAVTAGVMEGDEQKCLAVGMDDYLAKPIDHLILIEKLSGLLKT